MLNHIWIALILAGALLAGFTGQWKEAVDGAIKAAETAVTLILGLVGIMSLWLGLMRLAERSGLVQVIARGLLPLLRRLFPDVPVHHPAMGSMVLNIAANLLGLNNAATPLGLRAMRDLETLNRHPGTATNAMCTFLAINTGSVQLLPMSAIALMAAAGSTQPTAIVGTTLLTTLFSSAAGLVTVKWLERWPRFRLPDPPSPPSIEPSSTDTPAPETPASSATDAVPRPPHALRGTRWIIALFLGFFLVAGFRMVTDAPDTPDLPGRDPVALRSVHAVSTLAIPFLLAFFPLYAALHRIPVYEEFVQGAKEGFQTAIGIIPYLVAMLVAIGFFRGSGGIGVISALCTPLFERLHFPTELLPMALLRPLTGSGTLAALADLIQNHGPDSLISRMGGTLFGSTETTFYVLAVYFGSVRIQRTRHAVWAGLAADLTGIIAAVIICRAVFPGLS